MTDKTSTAPRRGPVARVLMAVLLFQLGLGVLLVMGDLRGSLSLPGGGRKSPQLTEPIRPGDQTRRFEPNKAPPGGQPFPTSPLPERLVLTEVDEGALLEGTIATGDAERIAAQIETLRPVPQRLYLNSPGGSVRDALALGRFVRDAGIDTGIRDGDVCYSACPYLLAAGVRRTVPDSASVGVHQHYFGENTILPAFIATKDIQRGQAEVMRYLDQMDIDLLIMQHALATPPDEIYVLLPKQLQKYGLTTEAE